MTDQQAAHHAAVVRELQERVRALEGCLRIWTDLSDMPAERFVKKYGRHSWSAGLDLFSDRARELLKAKATGGDGG